MTSAWSILSSALAAEEDTLAHHEAVQHELNASLEFIRRHFIEAAAAGAPALLRLPRRLLAAREALQEERRRAAKAGLLGNSVEKALDALGEAFLAAVRQHSSRVTAPATKSPQVPTTASSIPAAPTPFEILRCDSALRATIAFVHRIQQDVSKWFDPADMAARLGGIVAGSEPSSAPTSALFEEWYRIQWVSC